MSSEPTTPSLPSPPQPRASDRLISCTGLRNEGNDCGQHIWDMPGFYTVCCDGEIMDITGTISWGGIENLACCRHQIPGTGMSSGTNGVCRNGDENRTPLSALMATSTEVAKPRTTEVDGVMKTLNPECYWTQQVPDDFTSTNASPVSTSKSSATSSVATSGSNVVSDVLTAISKSGLSSTNVGGTNSATITSPVSSPSSVATTSSAETAQKSDAVSTSLAVAIVLPRWSLPVFFLLSLALSV